MIKTYDPVFNTEIMQLKIPYRLLSKKSGYDWQSKK